MSNPDGNDTFAYFGTQGSTGIKFDPNNFMILDGVVDLGGGSYVYSHTSHEYPGGIKIVFTATQKPIIGDKVVNGVLVPRPIVPNPARDVFQDGWPEPVINNDPGFQAKDKIDKEWPDTTKGL